MCLFSMLDRDRSDVARQIIASQLRQSDCFCARGKAYGETGAGIEVPFSYGETIRPYSKSRESANTGFILAHETTEWRDIGAPKELPRGVRRSRNARNTKTSIRQGNW